MIMRSITALSLAVALIVLSYSCGSKEAAPDASAPDGMLPPGVQGDILRVPEVQSTTIPELQGPVQVVRVEAGIPHVFASNEHDLRVVQGYLSARARLYFFEIGRLYALGRIGELLGDVRLEADIQARSQGMAYVAQRILEKLSPEQAEDIDNFVKGVNAFVANVKSGVEAPPVEVPILGPVLLERPATNLLPEYTRADVAAFAAAITYDQGFETDEPLRELVLAQLQGAFDDLPFAEQREQGAIADLWGRVQPIVEVSSTPGFGVNGEAPARTSASLPSPVSLPASMLERLERRHELSPGIFHRQRGVDFGSNEWAVMGSHTRDGRTLLAGDGHLSLSVPALFMQIGLDTTVFGDGENGLRQVGMTFPGSPVMGPGTNGSVAWTITYFDGDVTDWYREEIRLSADGMPEASRFRGEWKPLIKVDETYEFRSVPALGSEARTIVMPRFQTFDGRWITAIEGVDATEETTASTGETLLNIYGSWVIPKDTDSDGVISGISFDYTGFDIGQTLGVVDAMGRANPSGRFGAHWRPGRIRTEYYGRRCAWRHLLRWWL